MGLESNESVVEQQDIIDIVAEDHQSSSAFNMLRKKSPMFHPGVTWLDRWLVRKMLDVVGNPPVRISL